MSHIVHIGAIPAIMLLAVLGVATVFGVLEVLLTPKEKDQ